MHRHLVLALPLIFLAAAPEDRPLYKDAAQPVERRVADLLGRMTLEEKVAQTLGLWKRKERITEDDGRFSPAKAAEVLGHGIGQLARPSELRDRPARIVLGPRENAVFVDAVQKWLVENTRLGIPALTHEEALHGLAAPKGTNFPVPIALASSWDPALVERVMSAAALEARARGTHEVLSPVIDLARDPRWGRTEETYGEDPYLVSRMGVAAIRGYQGTSQVLARPIACGKLVPRGAARPWSDSSCMRAGMPSRVCSTRNFCTAFAYSAASRGPRPASSSPVGLRRSLGLAISPMPYFRISRALTGENRPSASSKALFCIQNASVWATFSSTVILARRSSMRASTEREGFR